MKLIILFISLILFGFNILDVHGFPPTIISAVTPASLSIAGGEVLTIYGSGFGTNCAAYTYVQVGTITPTGSPGTCTDSWIIATYGDGGTGTNLPLYLAWGQGSYIMYGNAVTFHAPTITNVIPNYISHSYGGTITIYGNYLGLRCGFYTYLQAGANPQTGYASNCNAGSYIEAIMPPGGTGTNLPIYLAWGSGSYTQLNNAVSYN